MWREQLRQAAEQGALDAEGEVTLLDNKSYYVQVSERERGLFAGVPVFRPLADSGFYEVNFANCLGHFRIGDLQVRVISAKVTSEQFERLVEEISDYLVNLPFSYYGGKGSFQKSGTNGQAVLYQTVAYVFSLLQRQELQQAVQQIVQRPHLAFQKESTRRRVEQSGSATEALLRRMGRRPEELVRLPAHSQLHHTSLSRRLGGHFPEQVHVGQLQGRADNRENQFVKFFLRLCEQAADQLSQLSAPPPVLKRVAWVKRELRALLRLPFFQEIQTRDILPFASQVLQKQSPYKELFGYYNRLNLLSEYAKSEDWQRMIELKDVALLYEYWTFIKVCQVVEEVLGRPLTCSAMRSDAWQAHLPYAFRLEFVQQVTLWYNRTYTQGAGSQHSYSVTLRPDVVLQVGERCYVLDAKFKVKASAQEAWRDEERMEDGGGSASVGASATFQRADLYKMHAYRDAIRGCRAALIVYPGDEPVFFAEQEQAGEPFQGVGALPLQLGGSVDGLRQLVKGLLDLDQNHLS